MKKLLLFTLLFISFNLSAQTNNYSLVFDGVDDYVVSNNSTSIGLVRSVCFWGKVPAGGMNVSPSHNVISLSSDFNITFGDWGGNNIGGISLHTSGSWVYNNSVVDDGAWHFYCIKAIDGTQNSVTFYQDGLLLVNQFVGGNYNYSSSNSSISFGQVISGGNTFNGLLDEVSVWNIELDSNQIQQYMQCPPSFNDSGLVGYWNFEEGIGNTVADLTSNANDGTLNGGVAWGTDVPPLNCCTPNPITSQPTDQTVNIGNNATISFADTLTGASYQWQMDAGTGYSDLSNAGQFSGAYSDSLSISSTTMGNNNTNYRCIVTESASCLDTTDVANLTVVDNTSIGELNNSLVKLFPNPSNDIITLTLEHNSNGQIILTDILGKKVLSKSFTSNEVQINLKSLESTGTYFAKVLDLDGNVIAIKKLIYQ
ncbi:T9SS type A sorting domain-containing protein [Crocinitomicaceae bacterium]|nr:T9SS type A sorting domain-containing protein [bacterium]MDB2656901.1 T9SS type A sorting domain-containing protein [Crocinitomicaceae bacterium]MDC0257229.1 T9SS type A sorting domain-containing protein [Crocinitomicaceae bacterium]